MYSYCGSIAVGTPPVAYDVVLDTGSADLWPVDSQCTENCNGLPPYVHITYSRMLLANHHIPQPVEIQIPNPTMALARPLCDEGTVRFVDYA